MFQRVFIVTWMKSCSVSYFDNGKDRGIEQLNSIRGGRVIKVENFNVET